MNKYKNWFIFDSLPEGWIVDKTSGSPLANSVFITNGKSVLNGQKRALLRVKPTNNSVIFDKKVSLDINNTNANEEKQDFIFPVKTVNTLARKKFQESLFKEIKFDLTVCELEGWDKKEYINELKKLLNSFNLSKKVKRSNIKQQSLFIME